MKIALVILHADPARGGAERYTIDLARALDARGHDVALLAATFAGDVPRSMRRPIEAAGVTRAGRYRCFLDALDAHLNERRYDVVHAMLPVRRCDLYHPHAGMAVEQMRKSNRLMNPRRGLMARIERQLLSASSPPIVIALSDYVKRSILKHYPLADDRLATLFNAVAIDRFDPARPHGRDEVRREYGIAHGEVAGLIVAQDFERKGVPQAIEALNRVNADRANDQPRMRLLVVGAGHPPASEGDVIFAGAKANIIPFYAAGDFFVLPTRHDPCSLVVLEALAMGLPVISTIYNGATEIMTDGVHGHVLRDSCDLDGLVDAMRRMLILKHRRAMSEACLTLRSRLAYQHHVDRLLNIYTVATAKPL